MLKLQVGSCKKVGDPNFGSHGASVELAIELDGSLIADPDQLRERIRALFALAKASIDEELHGRPQPADDRNGAATNGHAPSNGRGTPRDGTRGATASQVRALHAIANRRRLDLEALLVQRYQIHDPTALTITEASSLIDELKSDSGGNGLALHRGSL